MSSFNLPNFLVVLDRIKFSFRNLNLLFSFIELLRYSKTTLRIQTSRKKKPEQAKIDTKNNNIGGSPKLLLTNLKPFVV